MIEMVTLSWFAVLFTCYVVICPPIKKETMKKILSWIKTALIILGLSAVMVLIKHTAI